MSQQGAAAQDVRVPVGTEEGTQQQKLSSRESSRIPPGRASFHHRHRGSINAGVAAHGTADDGVDYSMSLKVRGGCWFDV